MERLTIPDKKIDGGVRRAFIDVKAVKENAMTIYWALKRYEDTGLAPEQIMELSESVKKLQEHFGDAITADQVIDFFVDFYIAQGDPERTEGALLLTNEAVTEYRELKERDKPRKIELNAGVPICPVCGRRVVRCYDFCPDCGQRMEQ